MGKDRCRWTDGKTAKLPGEEGDRFVFSCTFVDKCVLAAIADGHITTEQAINSRKLPSGAVIIEGDAYCSPHASWCTIKETKKRPAISQETNETLDRIITRFE